MDRSRKCQLWVLGTKTWSQAWHCQKVGRSSLCKEFSKTLSLVKQGHCNHSTYKVIRHTARLTRVLVPQACQSRFLRDSAASSPSGLPQPPLARGMSGSNVPGRGDSFVAPQTSSTSTDRIVPQAQTDQISTLPEASARPECNNASDVERSSLAAREQNDTPSRGYDNTVDGEGSAYGTPSAGTPEIDQPSLASIPIWGTGHSPSKYLTRTMQMKPMPPQGLPYRTSRANQRN
jgi:hypothetical protein